MSDVCGFCNQAESEIPSESDCAKLAPCATEEFYAALRDDAWPGNVRQLEHFVEKLAVTVLEERLNRGHSPALTIASMSPQPDSSDLTLKTSIRIHIDRVLRVTGYNQSETGRILGIPLSTLRNKMKKVGLNPR